jgi:hypothetical protein
VRLGLDTADSAETIEQREDVHRLHSLRPEAGKPDVALPEKRKVGSSTLPLTTSFGLASGALTSVNADLALSRLQPSSDRDCPCVAVVGRLLSHADRTLRVRASRWPPLRPELAAPQGVWLSSQLAWCAGGRARWRLCGGVAALPCFTIYRHSSSEPAVRIGSSWTNVYGRTCLDGIVR